MYRVIRKNIFPALILFLLAAALALLGSFADRFAAVLRARITLCLTTLIPSLFGCTAAAELLRRCGAGERLGYRLRAAGRWLHMPAAAVGIFLMSQFAGYPAGALLLRGAEDSGELSEADAARLSYVCFGGGPAFLVGLAGRQLLGSAGTGWCMMLACLLANLLLAAVLLRLYPCSAGHTQPAEPPAVRLSASAVTDSVTAAVKSLARICGMVLFFGLLSACGDLTGLQKLPAPAGALAAAAMDITQIPALFHCGLRRGILLPLSTGLLAFGGICVHWQCLALGSRSLSAAGLFRMRLLAAGLAAAFMYLMLPLLPVPEAVPAFANRTALSESGSVWPAILIFCTGFPFLIKKD